MRAEQRWYAGGAIGALLILLVGYFLIISPEKADGDSLNSQTATILTQNIATKNRLNKLQVENGKLNQYKATLNQQQAALPPVEDLTDFIRDLQAAGITAGVQIASVAVGTSTAIGGSTGASTGTSSGSTPGSAVAVSATGTTSITLTVTANGSGGQLQGFLDQLQNQSARAVLVTGASIKSVDSTGNSIAGADTMIATLQIFVSPSPIAQAEGS